ncbi:glycosyltransferase [Floricoccus tropicus]|uniref:Glycosyltransferase n=1 Tax=Floricoccus tropicus TaxID=1859473 RepID=A0A1E8GKZ3_9LACT|nr:glycosyltransferase family 4 protein [Floricoccus tropicus]OFI48922.1 glycosyltransferase [Floricoccus tropicus]
MLDITMFSKADSIKGQGVGSAYLELINMLKNHFPNEFNVKINNYSKADISHYHTINPTYYLTTFQKKKRGVKVGYVHFLPDTLEGSINLYSPIQKYFDKYLLSFYKKMDEIVVVNPSFIPALIDAGCDENKITYIPNFVSRSLFYRKTSEDNLLFRKKLGIDNNKFIVFGVGQIQKRKGIDDFIKLAMDNPDIQFIWAGGFSFGKITDGYDEYKKIYDNPPKNLLFPGILDRSELVDYYNIADVFLLPSYNELFPMSILEAFNCGTAVMVRDLDLYKSVIDGYYIGCEDVLDMDREIKKLSSEPEEIDALSRLSKKASDYYSEDNVAGIWFDYYTSVYEKHKNNL